MTYVSVIDKLKALQELIDLGEAGGFSEWDRGFVPKMSRQYRRTFQFSPRQEYQIKRIYKEQFQEEENDGE